jgi:two-component system cell cycle response regulator DivK
VPTALVVEDDARSQKLACTLLELRGFSVFAARTSGEGLRLAAERVPDIILMDIQLRGADGGDGMAALTSLRNNPATAHIPVLAITAFAMKGDEERFLAHGFSGYVAKPIDAHSFVDVVLSFLRGPEA